jgi:hypothetical protein
MAILQIIAVLTDEDGNPLQGKTINIYVDGSRIYSGQTDNNGIVETSYTVGPGTHTVRAEFPGDPEYEPSSAETTVTVPGVQPQPAPVSAGVPGWVILGGLLLLVFVLGGKRRRA